ncbi:MAG: YeeE/YedE family protein [Rhodospirillales bacterium]
MLQIIASLIAGTLMGAGLMVSGMMNPNKVLSFLDVFGNWDPTLIFVMGGAIFSALPGFWLSRRLTKPLLANNFQLPDKKNFDRRLVGGAAIFGVGWGLVGLCPGPAISAITTGSPQVIVFVISMTIGMAFYRWKFSS